MSEHIPVLLHETIEGLNLHDDGIYVDCTVGRGGHSEAILKGSKRGSLYAFDQDEEAIEASKTRLTPYSSRVVYLLNNFSFLSEELARHGIHQIDGCLMDLGVSSPQFDEAERGFSYRYDAPLDMRMDRRQAKTAYVVVNSYEASDLIHILQAYGEEPFAKAIVRQIIKRRSEKPIATTGELVDVIRSALPAKVLAKPGHPAKQVFQAIRIEVNNELQVLEKGLEQALDLLAPGGRLAVITFHSLEDRIVKHFFRKKAVKPSVPRNQPDPHPNQEMEYRLITKQPIVPSVQEIADNPRAASAKLRIIERINPRKE